MIASVVINVAIQTAQAVAGNVANTVLSAAQSGESRELRCHAARRALCTCFTGDRASTPAMQCPLPCCTKPAQMATHMQHTHMQTAGPSDFCLLLPDACATVTVLNTAASVEPAPVSYTPPLVDGSPPLPVDSGSPSPPPDSGPPPPPADSGSPPPPVDSGSPSPPPDSGPPPPPADSGSPSPPVDSGSPPPPVDSGSPRTPATLPLLTWLRGVWKGTVDPRDTRPRIGNVTIQPTDPVALLAMVTKIGAEATGEPHDQMSGCLGAHQQAL